MVLPKSLLGSLGTLLLAASARAADAANITDDAVAVPASLTGRYIVKFSADGASQLSRRNDGSVDASSFYAELADAGHEATPARAFDSSLFRGVSFDLSGATNATLASIQALPAVERVWPAGYFTVPVSAAATTVRIDTSADAGSSSVVGAYNVTYSRWSVHNNTNVARVQADGHLGDGVVIGMVDTGIDYTHPALGGGFGSGFKIIGGYDLVGDAYVAGSTNPVPDDDPMDCLGHGTHTAGIAASLDSLVPGVAPAAQLRAYKVFGCSDGTYEDNIVAAFLMAYADGVDVISASLGSSQGFPDTAMAAVATSISNAGVFVSIAAGNSGQSFGPFYTSSGGNGAGASVAVASVQSSDWVGYAVHAESSSGASREMVYLSSDLAQFSINGTVDTYFPPDVRNIDACDLGLPAAPSGAVYIIPRGTCASQLQDSMLFNRATYVFYVLNSSAFAQPTRSYYSSEQPAGAAALVDADGDWLLAENEAGHTVTLTFADDHAALGIPRTDEQVLRVNDFSSWGPTLDGRMKPEIAAPGGSILSTWPVAAGSWAAYSGTSMAAPYIAGVAALFFGARGGRASLGAGAAALARSRIVASGSPVYHNDGTGNLASVARQGAGLVDALKVIEYSTTVQPAVLQLNDTDHFVGEHTLAVTNDGADRVTFQIDHLAGPTALSKSAGDAWVSLEPPYSTDAGDQATVVFSAGTLTLGPGETASFTVTFTEPASPDASYMPIYGGQIRLTGSNGETVSAAYMGIKGSLYGSDIWEMERGTPLFLSGSSGYVVEGTNYTFADGSPVPQAFFNVLWSTSEISFDFVTRDWTPSDWVYPPVAGANNWVGSMRLASSNEDFPFHDYPRAASGVYAKPQGALAGGEKLVPGEYMLLARTLRTFGDYNNLEDWQYKVSPWFRVVGTDAASSSAVSSTSMSATSSVPSTLSASSASAAASSVDVSSVSSLSSPVSSVVASSVASSTVASATPVCTAATNLSLTVYVGNDTVGHQLYRYSDFLAVDLTNSQSSDLTEWQSVPTDSGTFHLKTSSPNSEGTLSDVFASVLGNTNSLVYLYAASRIGSSWSYLECSIHDDGTLNCVSGSKLYFYTCDSTAAVVRHGSSVLDGCTALRIAVGVQKTGCPLASSSAVPSTSSQSVSLTSFLSSFSSSLSSGPSTAPSTTPWTSSQSASSTSSLTASSPSSSPAPSSVPSSASSAHFSAPSSAPSSDSSASEFFSASSTLSVPPVSSASSSSESSAVSPLSSASQSASQSFDSSAVSSSASSPAGSSAFSSSFLSVPSASSSVASGISSPVSSHTSSAISTVVSSAVPSTSTSTVSKSSTSPSVASSVASSTGSSVTSSAIASSASSIARSISPSSSEPAFTTSTVFSTSTATITACPSTVAGCPANSRSTYTTSIVVAVSTTVCPVTSTEATTTESAAHVSNSASTLSLLYGSGRPVSGPDTLAHISTKAPSVDVGTKTNVVGTSTTAAAATPAITHTVATTTTTAGAEAGAETGETTVPATSPSGSTRNGNNSASGSGSGSASSSNTPTTATSDSSPAASSTVVTAGSASLFRGRILSHAMALLSLFIVL